MEVLPLLTPSKFNSHKRSRSDDDVDTNYFKKRLLSLSPTKTTEEEDARSNTITTSDKLQQEKDTTNSPLQEKLGETMYCIPGLVLNKKNSTPTSLEAAQAGRLILYRPNTYLPLSPPSSPQKEEAIYEPMEID